MLLSVRLECVMHAASVNPEPGSNSLKNCIFSVTLATANTFFRAIYLSFFFYFFEFLNVLLTRMHNLVLFKFRVVQFSMINAALEVSSSIILYLSSNVKSFFEFFYRFFSFSRFVAF